MRFPLFMTAVFVLLASAVPAEDAPIEGDLAKLQGSWSGKTGRNGIFFTVWTINKDTLDCENTMPDGRKVGFVSKLVVDGRAKPRKTMDCLIIRRNGGSGNAPDRVLGIYEFIDDDTIRVCNNSPERPSEFKQAENGLPIMFTLKRDREKKKLE